MILVALSFISSFIYIQHLHSHAEYVISACHLYSAFTYAVYLVKGPVWLVEGLCACLKVQYIEVLKRESPI